MSSDEGRTVKAAGMRYLVTVDGFVTGGIIDGRGIMSIDPSLRNARPMLLSQLTSVDGVNVLPYQDESQSYKLAILECLVTLDYKPDKYLGIYSHNFSTHYKYNLDELCGDCDGTRNEMGKLPAKMVNSVRSLSDRDAAMLYMTSQHISSEAGRCYDYKQMVHSCPKDIVLRVLGVCGQIMDPAGRLFKCLSGRTFMGHILDTFYDCVQMFCSGNPRRGCRHLSTMANSMLCGSLYIYGC